jgi:hypothetical protein
MAILETYGKEIVAICVPFITWGLNTMLKPKARLLLASPHNFTFLIHQPKLDIDGKVISPTQTVQTKSIVLRNTGKETAKNVELVFNWKPLCINVWPSRHYTEHNEPDRRCTLIFDSLAPNEVLGCELLTINENLPDLITARSEQCVAQTIEMYPQPIVKNWQRQGSIFLGLTGLALAVYLGILLLQFLVLRTPLGH